MVHGRTKHRPDDTHEVSQCPELLMAGSWPEVSPR